MTDRRARQEQKRLRAGASQTEVARATGVNWRSVHEWHRAWKQGGADALKSSGKPGPQPKFSDAEAAKVAAQLRRGAPAHGYANEVWTLPRVKRLVEEMYGRKVSASETWRLLRRVGWSTQKPARKGRERDEGKIARWKNAEGPRIKEKAREEKRTIVFIDERGLSQKPAVKNTWAPQGETPVLELNFN